MNDHRRHITTRVVPARMLSFVMLREARSCFQHSGRMPSRISCRHYRHKQCASTPFRWAHCRCRLRCPENCTAPRQDVQGGLHLRPAPGQLLVLFVSICRIMRVWFPWLDAWSHCADITILQRPVLPRQQEAPSLVRQSVRWRCRIPRARQALSSFLGYLASDSFLSLGLVVLVPDCQTYIKHPQRNKRTFASAKVVLMIELMPSDCELSALTQP